MRPDVPNKYVTVSYKSIREITVLPRQNVVSRLTGAEWRPI